jgi:putative ABC transport system ATP-binding protein
MSISPLPRDGSVAIELRTLTVRYQRARTSVTALLGISLEVPRGEFISIVGPSGSGKSTLLHVIAGLELPTEGEVRVDGQSIGTMSDDELTDMRRTRVGLVFQFFNLLPNVTAVDNVSLPLRMSGVSHRLSLTRAEAALARVGLGDHGQYRPAELSGGEMQRVAIARALAIEPAIILADEPTGNLDTRTGADILQLLRDSKQERGVTVVLVTHSEIAAAYGDRIIMLRDGHILDDVITRPGKPAPHFRPVS